MAKLTSNRAFVSAATAFTFIPTMVTSLLLLFHLKFPGMMSIHKWVGLAFIILCCCHIPINWAVLRKHLGGRAALPALGLSVLLTFGMFLWGMAGGDGDGQRHNNHYASQGYVKKHY